MDFVLPLAGGTDIDFPSGKQGDVLTALRQRDRASASIGLRTTAHTPLASISAGLEWGEIAASIARGYMPIAKPQHAYPTTTKRAVPDVGALPRALTFEPAAGVASSRASTQTSRKGNQMSKIMRLIYAEARAAREAAAKPPERRIRNARIPASFMLEQWSLPVSDPIASARAILEWWTTRLAQAREHLGSKTRLQSPGRSPRTDE